MAASRTRQEARERAEKIFSAALGRVIPAEESKPLTGARFWDSRIRSRSWSARWFRRCWKNVRPWSPMRGLRSPVVARTADRSGFT